MVFTGERANGKINPRHWRHVCGQVGKTNFARRNAFISVDAFISVVSFLLRVSQVSHRPKCIRSICQLQRKPSAKHTLSQSPRAPWQGWDHVFHVTMRQVETQSEARPQLGELECHGVYCQIYKGVSSILKVKGRKNLL